MLFRNKQQNHLKRITNPQSPGLCKIYFVPVERMATDVSIFTEPGVIGALPDFLAKFSTAELTSFSKDYSETEKEDDAGDYFEIIVSGLLPFENKANYLNLKAMKQHRYILLVKTPSGLIKFLGCKENPVKMTSSYGTGKKSGGTGSATAVSFFWRSEDRPLIMNGPIPESLLLL